MPHGDTVIESATLVRRVRRCPDRAVRTPTSVPVGLRRWATIRDACENRVWKPCVFGSCDRPGSGSPAAVATSDMSPRGRGPRFLVP